jgi:hypothetical protein
MLHVGCYISRVWSTRTDKHRPGRRAVCSVLRMSAFLHHTTVCCRTAAPASLARPRIFNQFQKMPLIWFTVWPVNSKSRRNYAFLSSTEPTSGAKCVTVEFVVSRLTRNTLTRKHKQSNTDFFPNKLCANKNVILIWLDNFAHRRKPRRSRHRNQ